MGEFEKICADIKSIKIQGATNVAKAAIRAYSLKPSKETKKKLFSLRPTEPTMFNALNMLEKSSPKEVLQHFTDAQGMINIHVLKILSKKINPVVFTHCHSTNVIKALIYAGKEGKKFKVYNTETRPLYQGRITAKELATNKIPVTTVVDSGAHSAIEEADFVFLGADAILSSGVINKIGSEGIAEMAHVHKTPFYIIADSWKFYPKNVKIEERSFHEVWNNAPKNIKVLNSAFEKIPREYVKKVISEFGALPYSEFLREAKSGF